MHFDEFAVGLMLMIHCLQDYTELLEENQYFYKPFTTADVINRNEIKLGGESRASREFN